MNHRSFIKKIETEEDIEEGNRDKQRSKKRKKEKLLPTYFIQGFKGSPLFASELNHRSFIDLSFSSKFSAKQVRQLSLTGWVRPDKNIINGSLLASPLFLFYSRSRLM